MSLDWNEEVKKELGACGQNVFIGHNVMFARPKDVFLGDNVRIDPFALITCGLVANGNNQISSHAIMNGRKTVHLGKWVGFGYRATVLTGSEDFSGDYGPANDWFGKNPSFEAHVIFEDYSNLLTNSLVLPGVTIPEGVVIAANSIVTSNDELEPYWIYGMKQYAKRYGENPSGMWAAQAWQINAVALRLQKIRERNRDNIRQLAGEWENEQRRLSDQS